MNFQNRCCAVVNTHSSYHDVLAVFLKSYLRYMKDVDLFVFSDKPFDSFKGSGVYFFKYSSDNFRDQYLECLQRIPYKYLLTFNDDYFLNGFPNYAEISRCIDIMDNNNYSQVRLVRGSNFIPSQVFKDLYLLDINKSYFYSQTLSIWKKNDLVKVFDLVGPSGIGRKKLEPQFEVLANNACREISLSGLVYYKNEKKIGSAHYECSVIPHIVSAIVDGRWNTKEYKVDLKIIERELCVTLNKNRFLKTKKEIFKEFFL
jgi:hypothetical protein